MENVVLSIHLILALLLIGVVLLQRSEGGGLGMGGGGSSGGVGGLMTGRQAANALTRLTWILAAGFLITSVTLTVLASRKAGQESVLDRLGIGGATISAPADDSTGITDQSGDEAGDKAGSLGVIMPPAASGPDAGTGETPGESATDSRSGPITPPAAN